ncbi:hypothetical protein B5T_03617 [Alloalcanivorax dieselolei B5]|uniref:Transmembrane protein n=1 Tax=Alcanivorax dieselolei (strain DSM 16502 / CGMCC 1.3690 / MCCC 1A00001 / B-5) TaxID=930169 RepID=K0CJH2_ALCDB|nr:hypothetical protein [Alloalcanivorax dieselolei]AFT71882.1 hypothetical protein B5T_03617 [Alloalcanivorax dieselolei B5]GGK01770.1 hypothetical protein GCM10007426_33490 [Alloalcanivorax dieselolei]
MTVVLLAALGLLGLGLIVLGMMTMEDCPSRSDCLAWRMLGVIIWLPTSLMFLGCAVWLWRWPSWWALTPLLLPLLLIVAFVTG